MVESCDAPVSLLIDSDGQVPNNSRLAVLHYRSVFGANNARASALASRFEALFARHAWPPAWRNGIFDVHHFHSTAHEVLGICSGTVTVRLGGEGGYDVVLRPGDVAVLPAGIAHKQIHCEGALLVVGAYPDGQTPDHCEPHPEQLAMRAQAVEAVPMPDEDPVFGINGPLVQHWRAAST